MSDGDPPSQLSTVDEAQFASSRRLHVHPSQSSGPPNRNKFTHVNDSPLRPSILYLNPHFALEQQLGSANLQRVGNELDLIGDPTVLGWTTFGLYLIAAMLSFRAASASGPRGSPVFSYIWKLMAAILLVLGINKQLDLQTWMIELARRTVPKAHFQEYRVALHALCFFSLIFLIGVVLFRWPEKVKLFGRQLPMAATGCALVVTYILARAASIDHVDRVLGFDLERLPFLWVLETGGLALIIAQALGIITCAK